MSDEHGETSAALISDEPLVNAIHKRVVGLLLAIYTAGLIYVSLVPFDFTRHAGGGKLEATWGGLAVSPFPLLDILANIGIYVPLGALALGVARRRGLHLILSGILAVALAVAVSLPVEYAQLYVASRVSSWVDVLSNVLGAGLGAAIAGLCEPQIRRTLGRTSWAVRRNWPLTLCKVAVCIVLLVQLRPYDVVTDLYHTATDLRHADVSPLAVWQNLPAQVHREYEQGRRRSTSELPRVQWEYALDRAVDIALYATIIALAAIGLAGQFASRRQLYLWAGFIGVSVATIVMVIRVFLASHGLDTSHLLCGVLGWPIGCLVARHALRVEQGELPAAVRASSHALRQAAICLVVGTALMYELVPFDFGTGDGADSPFSTEQMCLVPFLPHFYSRPNDAIYDISGELLLYATVGSCFSLWLGACVSWPWRRQLLVVVGSTTTLCLALQGVHLIMASRFTGTTAPILAALGAFGAAVGVRWVHDYRRSLHADNADDLLTRQLVEGETYRGLQKPRSRKAAGQSGAR
ncbi:MAG: VanZ family protein [Planctomycetota bacterium]